MEFKDPVVRSIRIVQLLADGKKVTVNKLFELFEGKISKRTLQRDLIKISEAGIPVTTDQGSRNEYVWYIDNQFYRFVPTPLSLNEYMVANYMKKAVPVFRNTPLETDYNSLLDKLDQLLTLEIFEVIDTHSPFLKNSFETLEFGYYDYSNYRNIILDIIKSIEQKNEVKTTYKSAQSKVCCF